MALVRLATLSHTERERIRYRQKHGTMATYTDKDGYLCYDKEDLKEYKPRKKGRPRKIC